MPNLHDPDGAIYFLQIIFPLILAIGFIQSGVDKVIDWRGNLDWLTGHFAKSPLAGVVPVLLFLLTILELGSGFISGIGFIVVLMSRDTAIAFWGAVLSTVTLTALFFGQRVAKEYAGAAVLVPYFLLAAAAVYLLSS
jgi:hypothetical protein